MHGSGRFVRERGCASVAHTAAVLPRHALTALYDRGCAVEVLGGHLADGGVVGGRIVKIRPRRNAARLSARKKKRADCLRERGYRCTVAAGAEHGKRTGTRS